jgi:hypothetical protein
MSRPTNPANPDKKVAANSKELRRLFIDTNLEITPQRLKYVEQKDKSDTLNDKVQSQLEIEIGLGAKIAKDKKELERTRREILKQERVLRGHKGVEAYAETKRKEYLTQLLISDASLVVSEEENRVAAYDDRLNLYKIESKIELHVDYGGHGIIEAQKVAAYVLQLKELATSLELKPIVGPKKAALVTYLKTLNLTEAANSIDTSGYITDPDQRNAVSKALNELQDRVTNANKPLISKVNPLSKNDNLILRAILLDEIDKLIGTEKAALAKRDEILARSSGLTFSFAKTIVAAVNDKKEDRAEEAKKHRDQAITDLNEAVPDLFNKLLARANTATEVVSVIDAKINQVLEILHDVKAHENITDTNKNTEAKYILETLFTESTGGVINYTDAENLLETKLKTIIKIRNNLLAGVAINDAEKVEAKRILPTLAAEIESNGTIPALLNALNGSDYKIASLAKEYDSIRVDANVKKTAAEGDIVIENAKRTREKNIGNPPELIDTIEDAIAAQKFELGGIEAKRQYLRDLKNEVRSERSKQINVQITKLNIEYNSFKKEQDISKSEETELDSKIIYQEKILQTKRLDKNSITSAEASGLTRDVALQLREKAIKAQRTALGEVAVKELAEKWGSESLAIAQGRENAINALNTAAATAANERDNVALGALVTDKVAATAQLEIARNAANERDNVALGALVTDKVAATAQLEIVRNAANERYAANAQLEIARNAANERDNVALGELVTDRVAATAQLEIARDILLNNAFNNISRNLTIDKKIEALNYFRVDENSPQLYAMLREGEIIPYCDVSAAIAQIRLLNEAMNDRTLNDATDRDNALAQHTAYKAAMNDRALNGADNALAQDAAYQAAISDAALNGAINLDNALAQHTAYKEAISNAVLHGAHDVNAALDQQRLYVAAQVARDDLAQVDKLEEIADKFFISDGYAGVEEFWNRQNDATKKNSAKASKDAAELEVKSNLDSIKTITEEKELLKTNLSKLEKEIAAAKKDANNKINFDSDRIAATSKLKGLQYYKSDIETSIAEVTKKIDDLKSALTLNFMKVGGQNLIAQNADTDIQNAALEARNQAILEEAEYKKFLELERASQENELNIEKQLSLYDIDYSITDEGKKLEITKTDESTGVASTFSLDSLVGEDKKWVQLASEVVKSLLSLNNDSNREMDLVPELRSSKQIQARPNSDGAEIFVVFDDPAQASAFCYKMNKFTKGTKPIIDPEAFFVTGFDSYGKSENELQQASKVLWEKKKIGRTLPIINKRFKIPEFEDESKPDLNGKYVVSISVGRERNTSITFVDDILNSERAKTLQDRVKNANRAERVIEKKDEIVKTALSAAANLTIVGPVLVGALASGLRWITEPAAKLGLPGSGILSAINQSMYDFAAATTKRGSLLGLVVPNTMEQLSNKFAKASDNLQKIQEENIAKGLFHWDSKKPLKSIFRPFENATMTVARIGFGIPAVISKGISFVAHGAGDLIIILSKYCSKTAAAQWDQGSQNTLSCVALFVASGVLAVVGLSSRAVGVITGGVGETFSRPLKAFNPEGSAASNRSKLGLGFGAAIRNMDRALYGMRNYLFTSKAETSLHLSAAGKMDSAGIKQKADPAQMKEKSNFNQVIQDIALDIKNPKFNQSSGIEGDNKKYIKVAQVSYNNNDYKVLLGVEGNVIITESGISKSGIPVSLNGKLPGFFTEVLNVVAETRESEEKASTSYLMGSTTAITMREFGEKFGGISSSSSGVGTSVSINEGKVLRGYLSTLTKKTYIINNLQNVAGYSVKVDENDHIHIGKIGEELKEIEEGKAATNLALFKVVSELSKLSKLSESEPSFKPATSKPATSIYNITVVEPVASGKILAKGKAGGSRAVSPRVGTL